jgi:hypothetical protein
MGSCVRRKRIDRDPIAGIAVVSQKSRANDPRNLLDKIKLSFARPLF